jgi:hypothetical protein
MATLPPLPNGIRVNFKGLVLSHPWQNTIYLNYSTVTPTQSDLDALAASISTAWSVNYAPVMINSVSV